MESTLFKTGKENLKASWIWKRGEESARNSYFFFRKSFTLPRLPSRAALRVSAVTRYELFVNGVFVGRGPAPSQPWHQYVDAYDVAPHLKAGENVVGVLVHFSGKYEGTRGGLIAELGGDGDVILGTDATWKVNRAAAWGANTHHIQFNQVASWQEHFDARLFPSGWDAAGFDDGSWETAALAPQMSRDFTLLPREIPFMSEQVVRPVAIAYVEECLDLANRHRADDLSISLSAVGNPEIRHSLLQEVDSLLTGKGELRAACSTKHLDGIFDGIHDPCLVLDFGRVVTARPRFIMEGVAGGMIDIGYAERLVDGHFNNAIECPFADRYTMRGGAETWQPMAWKGFRYVKLRFRSCFQPVIVRAVVAVQTLYPFEEKGAFASPDATLVKIFHASRETLRLCSNDSVVDTPWREQGQWLGDVAAITLPGIHSAFGDTRSTGKFLRQSAANQLPTGFIANMTNAVDLSYKHVIPDYSLWWIQAVWGEYLFTGEASWVHDLYPHALRILEAHLPHVNAKGMIEDMPYWVFIDWADVEKRGESAAYTALFYGTLETLGQMAALRGDAWAGERIRELRSRIALNFKDRFFDAGQGVYADARLGGALSPKISEHANLGALRWGLADAESAASVIRRFFVSKDLRFTESQPFYTTVTLSALAGAGRMDLALQVLRERWGARMVDLGHTSTTEEWYMNGSWRSGEFKGFFRSLSHAWSACPAEFLVRTLTGFEIVEAGCRTVRLTPYAAPFAYDVTIPTPRGSVRVSHEPGKQAKITVDGDVHLVGK